MRRLVVAKDLEDIDFSELLDSLPDSFSNTDIKIKPPAEFVEKLAYDMHNLDSSLSDEDVEYFYAGKVLNLLVKLGTIEYDHEKHISYHGSDDIKDDLRIDTTMWYRKL